MHLISIQCTITKYLRNILLCQEIKWIQNFSVIHPILSNKIGNDRAQSHQSIRFIYPTFMPHKYYQSSFIYYKLFACLCVCVCLFYWQLFMTVWFLPLFQVCYVMCGTTFIKNLLMDPVVFKLFSDASISRYFYMDTISHSPGISVKYI